MMTKYRSHNHPRVAPFNELVHEVIGRDISQFFGHDDVGHARPKVNITETPEKFTISLLVPGYTKEQLKITTEKETLTVKAEKVDRTAQEDERLIRREFQLAAFTRSFKLPETVDLNNITAEHVNGLLHVFVPKTAPAKPHLREISIG